MSAGMSAGISTGTSVVVDGPGPLRTHRRPTVVVVVLVASFAVMVSGLIAWSRTGPSAAQLRAHTRDAVLISAKQDIATLNTLDYRAVKAGIARWESRSTGKLHDQLAAVTPQEMQLLAAQKKISVGRVISAGLLSLGDDTATVIASVEVTVEDATSPGSAPTLKRNRFTADLARVGGDWRLENLQQVPVNIS